MGDWGGMIGWERREEFPQRPVLEGEMEMRWGVASSEDEEDILAAVRWKRRVVVIVVLGLGSLEG